MSGDEKFNQAFRGLVVGMRMGSLEEAINILAKQVAELRGLDFETEGAQIIAEAMEQGKSDYHERIHRESFELFQKMSQPEQEE